MKISRVWLLMLLGACTALANVAATAQGGRGGRGAAAPASPAVDPRDLSGFWELPPDGRNVPRPSLATGITQRSLDRYAAHDAKSLRWCHTIGVPAMMALSRPFDLRQNDQFMVIVPEHTTASNRWIYLNRSAHINPEIFETNTNGDSIGHWDGNTLVVDTIGFDPDHGLLQIPGGGFRTERSHLVERYRLLKNGAILSVVSTWTDPKVFRSPHSYEYRFNRLSNDYEPRPSVACDPYDEERGQFLTEPPQTRKP
jgi:hypothetical protein